MLNSKLKQELKSFLIVRKNLSSNWEFEKTASFCNTTENNFKEIMNEAIWWEKQFNGVIKNDNQLIYTIL